MKNKPMTVQEAGRKGGLARLRNTTKEQRQAIARLGVAARRTFQLIKEREKDEAKNPP